MASKYRGKTIMKYIIWDWNGTLFDDVSVCIKSMNKLLEKNHLPQIKDETEYRQKFSFPVINYYKTLKFDFNETPFEQLAKEFMEIYQGESLHCNLTDAAEKTISELNKKEYKQIILSASKKNNLIQQLELFKIDSYFEEILGLSDIYAKSKVEIAKDWFEDKKVESITVIGDTYHDFDVAKELNASCLLYSKGHQFISQNIKDQYKIFKEMSQILDYL